MSLPSAVSAIVLAQKKEENQAYPYSVWLPNVPINGLCSLSWRDQGSDPKCSYLRLSRQLFQPMIILTCGQASELMAIHNFLEDPFLESRMNIASCLFHET